MSYLEYSLVKAVLDRFTKKFFNAVSFEPAKRLCTQALRAYSSNAACSSRTSALHPRSHGFIAPREALVGSDTFTPVDRASKVNPEAASKVNVIPGRVPSFGSIFH